jgi:hypothetical protein
MDLNDLLSAFSVNGDYVENDQVLEDRRYREGLDTNELANRLESMRISFIAAAHTSLELAPKLLDRVKERGVRIP